MIQKKPLADVGKFKLGWVFKKSTKALIVSKDIDDQKTLQSY